MNLSLERAGVAVIVVTYQSEIERLGTLLDALAPQVDVVIVVDNCSDTTVAAWLTDRCGQWPEVIFLSENLGLAAAQNIGITQARECRAEYVVLFDQSGME